MDDNSPKHWRHGDRVQVIGKHVQRDQFGTLVRPDRTTDGQPGWLVKIDDRFSGSTIPTRNLRKVK